LTLAEAAAQAQELADAGDERALADLRRQWDDEVESAARDSDYRVRAVAFRAIAQFRFRQKLALLERGLEDESPACRGSALIAFEALSRDHPGAVNNVRRILHQLASDDGNEAVRRLAILCLKNGSAQRDTQVLLEGIAEDDEQSREVRETARKIAQLLARKARATKR
jgi:HEAT repeat protein